MNNEKLQKFLTDKTKQDSDGCWIWQGSKDPYGYGYVTGLSHLGTARRAHRIAFTAWNGPIPQGADICHRCNKPSCINPRHLYAGNDSSNRADRIAVAHEAGSKFPDRTIREVRRLRALGIPVKEISLRCGVSRAHIYLLCKPDPSRRTSRLKA